MTIIQRIALTICFFALCVGNSSFAQQPSSIKEKGWKLFEEDTPAYKEHQKAEIGNYMKTDKTPDDRIDFKAPSIEYLKEGNELKGTGGAVISGHGVQVQSESALYNSDTKDSDLAGNVEVTTENGVLRGEAGKFNLDSETGTFQKGQYLMEEGAYAINATQLTKLTEFEVEAKDTFFSTCQCRDNTNPWTINSRRCHVTVEGYAHCYGTKLELYNTPIFYTPYLGFPAKIERASGLLVPRFGTSSRDGFMYKQPIYIAPDDYTDIMLTPFVQTLTRRGAYLDYREAFSSSSNVSGRLLYSDERPRGNSLRGTDITGIYNPHPGKHIWSEDRFGGYLKQTWSSEEGALIPTGLVTDLKYVSDNILLKELDDNNIASRTSRYVTSTSVLRNSIGQYIHTELLGEYDQSILSSQKITLQRLPELDVATGTSFRPFGANLLGVKLNTKALFSITEFSRQIGYDGRRMDFNPSVSIPFRYRNYFDSAFQTGLHVTSYDMNSTLNSAMPLMPIDSSMNKTVPDFSYRVSTGVERVYALDEGNWLTDLTSIGAANQTNKLIRIKHTLEPTFKYLYVPNVTQDNFPLYDQVDRIKEKSLFVYGLNSRLMGRFSPVPGAENTIPEVTPEVNDLPYLEPPSLLDDIAGPRVSDLINKSSRLRSGQIRQLANVSLFEGYDFVEKRKDTNPLKGPFTDMTGNINLAPTRNLSIDFTSTYNREHQKFTSYESTLRLDTDRGHNFIARYSFVDNKYDIAATKQKIDQFQGGTELKLNERFRLGYFTRWDRQTSSFVETLGTLRMVSSCNCWYLDFTYAKDNNPNRERYLIGFTFGGLGGLAQGIPYSGYRSQGGGAGQ